MPRKRDDQPTAKASSLQDLQERQAKSLADLERFQQLAADPKLSPRAAAAAHHLARSAAASVRLGEKALAYATPHPDPETEKTLSLYRSLQLPLPSLGQTPVAPPGEADA